MVPCLVINIFAVKIPVNPEMEKLRFDKNQALGTGDVINIFAVIKISVNLETEKPV